jgi:2,3-bisphosphoglycerate-dependent phosphoglycerate mutase
MKYLILVRHGESRWNKSNRFTGWVDVSLSEKGIREALACANELRNLKIHMAFTSHLERTQQTLLIILAKQYLTGIFCHTHEPDGKKYHVPERFNSEDIPIYSSSALNERYYGDLQGMNKHAAREKYGHEKVFLWRRSFSIRPPGGESLKDVYRRTVRYFQRHVAPKISRNNIIISGHGNALRMLIKYIEHISDEKIGHLELPYGRPIVYTYERKKFKRANIAFTFNRPVAWDNIKNKKKK